MVFYNGDAELAPGLTLHAVGGHSAGLQFVRVKTRRGYVVIASDTTHFYENMASSRPFTTAFHIGRMLEGFDRLLELAPDEDHIVPGHDPLVMKLYPPPALNSKVLRCAWTCRHPALRRAAQITVKAGNLEPEAWAQLRRVLDIPPGSRKSSR